MMSSKMSATSQCMHANYANKCFPMTNIVEYENLLNLYSIACVTVNTFCQNYTVH